MFKRMTVEEGRAIVEFDKVGGGLVTKAVEMDGHSIPAEPLRGFSVCGADKKFVWADAVIRGNQVVVSSPRVAAPVAVRYAWADFPLCNLYNKEGFPAVPFRSDDFDMAGTGAIGTIGGIAVGKPFVCSHPIMNGLYGGLTDGDLGDNRNTAWATSGVVNFPKHVTVDLEGRFDLTGILVHNSALGGTRTVEVQISTDGDQFKTIGKTEFRNYTQDVFELTGLTERGASHVRLVFPDVHETSFQRKVNGFVFLRELEVHGVPASP
jgi:hypothetical protein